VLSCFAFLVGAEQIQVMPYRHYDYGIQDWQPMADMVEAASAPWPFERWVGALHGAFDNLPLPSSARLPPAIFFRLASEEIVLFGICLLALPFCREHLHQQLAGIISPAMTGLTGLKLTERNVVIGFYWHILLHFYIVNAF
jgi:hypothetical protein